MKDIWGVLVGFGMMFVLGGVVFCILAPLVDNDTIEE